MKIKIKNFDFIRESLDFLKILHVPHQICSPLFDLHHKYVIRRLSKWFILVYKYLKDSNVKYLKENRKKRIHKNIWIFWWQGKYNMPNIVRMCLASVYKHSSDHRVVLITKKNVKDYAKLPEYIYTLVNNGNISLTNFSDILEYNLLRYYGGLWIDATVFCVSDLSSKYFGELYTASGGYMKYHSIVSLGKWTEFFFGGDINQPLFVFMDLFFKVYWKYHSSLIDYFLIDYALNYAYYYNIGEFRTYCNNNVCLRCKPDIYNMQKYLNKPYNSQVYHKFIKDSPWFKLTYKIDFKKNTNTLYNFLIHHNKLL